MLPPRHGGGAGGLWGRRGGTLPQRERESLGEDGQGGLEGEGVQGGEGHAALSHRFSPGLPPEDRFGAELGSRPARTLDPQPGGGPAWLQRWQWAPSSTTPVGRTPPHTLRVDAPPHRSVPCTGERKRWVRQGLRSGSMSPCLSSPP